MTLERTLMIGKAQETTIDSEGVLRFKRRICFLEFMAKCKNFQQVKYDQQRRASLL